VTVALAMALVGTDDLVLVLALVLELRLRVRLRLGDCVDFGGSGKAAANERFAGWLLGLSAAGLKSACLMVAWRALRIVLRNGCMAHAVA
jgi:hypothetical protein